MLCSLQTENVQGSLCRNLTFSLTCTVEMLNPGRWPCLNVSSPGGRHSWGKEEGQREVGALMV